MQNEEFKITKSQLTCINILIKALDEAIKRDAFSQQEINKIIKTSQILTQNNQPKS